MVAIAAERVVICARPESAHLDALRKCAEQFAAKEGVAGGALSIIGDYAASIHRFADRAAPYDVVVVNGQLTAAEMNIIDVGFPRGEPQPKVVVLGYRQVIVVAHKSRQVAGLNYGQLGKVLRQDDNVSDWRNLGGAVGAVRCYLEPDGAQSRDVLRRQCMQFVDTTKGYRRRGWYFFREDAQACSDANDVIEKVRRDSNGIGFLTYQGQSLESVTVLSISRAANGPLLSPGYGVAVNVDYPLCDPVLLYVHPKAPSLALDFCNYLLGPEGAVILETIGLVTPYMQKQAEAKSRLADMKARKGPRLQAVGVEAGRSAFADMATEYVKAKAVIQLGYMPSESDVSSVGGFVMGGTVASTPPATQPEFRGPQLLFLADKPSVRAMEVHGEKWNALQPAEYMLAGRAAAAIIVNSTNKFNSLTLDQVRAIFGGEVDDWATIGGTGLESRGGRSLTPAPSPRGRGEITINRFGLMPRDPVAVIFANECLPVKQFRRVTLKKDTAEAVAAVSMDPQAIAFVDLSAIPGIGNAPLTGDFAAAGQTVKVLAIQLGTGQRAKVISPTAANIRNAMYPFSQRMFLYVHPQASETAKDFAKFIATCGGSEASPYADTVKAVMDTYQKHGLIPLADAAIERATKDALAAAQVKAVTDKAKPKGK